MPVKVYGNKKDTGPSRIKADAVCDNLNESNGTWNVTIASYSADNTVFSATGATSAALEKAIIKACPGYQYTSY